MYEPLPDHPDIRPTREAEPPPWDPAGPDVASAARVYDYLLGGGQNFAIDRQLAEQFLELEPDAKLIARHNRAFLGRAVRFLAGQGIRQFIDLGSGIPTVGNVHEIAQKIAPDARVVYADNDPVAVTLGRRLLADNPRTTVIEADLRHTDTILAHPDLQALVDVRQPVGVLAVAVLHFLLDAPHAVVGLYRDAVAPGSYLVISHLTGEHRAQEMAGISRLGTQAGIPSTPRTRTQIEVLFDGWDLVAPGLTWTAAWRAEREDLADIGDPARSNLLAGVAIKTHSMAARTRERPGMTGPPATANRSPTRLPRPPRPPSAPARAFQSLAGDRPAMALRTTQARAPPGTARWPRLFWRRARRENVRSGRQHTIQRKRPLRLTDEVAPQLGREFGNSIPTEGRDMQATLDAADIEDVFVLDVQIITDVPSNAAAARCSTNDGCASTCASSCASRG